VSRIAEVLRDGQPGEVNMNKAVRRLSMGLSLMVLLSLLAAATPALAGTAPSIDVDFSATPTSGYAPLDVQFTDETAVTLFSFLPADGLLSWIGAGDVGVPPCSWELDHWDFGDGGTSTAANPSHVYTRPGQYTVSLTYVWDCPPVASEAGFLPARQAIGNSRPGQIGTETKTRELYIAVLEPKEKKERPLEPARMSVSYLNVDPQQVLPNQEVVVSANVCNQGEEDGTKTATLMVSGNAEQSQSVGVSGGSCKQVVFRLSRAVPGTYQVSVDGMQGQFSVVGTKTVTKNVPTQQETGLGTAGILAIVVVGIVLVIALVLILKKE
jgi:PKD repeat protein